MSLLLFLKYGYFRYFLDSNHNLSTKNQMTTYLEITTPFSPWLLLYGHWKAYFFLYTISPLLITITTFFKSSKLFKGSLSTIIMSANFPTSIEPTKSPIPRALALFIVAANIACILLSPIY